MGAALLLYVIEGAAPLLTITLVWAVVLALRGNIPRHRKIAVTHAVATVVSYIVVIALVRNGYRLEGKTPEWILNAHLTVIYAIPLFLIALPATGLTGRRSAHRALAFVYAIAWTAALVTGAMIFMAHRGWLR